MKIIDIAIICHNLKKALCEAHGDTSQVDWNIAEEWQRRSVISGVQFALDNPNAPASAHHDAWMKYKIQNGWKYGPVKDIKEKEHPCLVPYEQLPPEEKAKDFLFKETVRNLSQYLD